MLGQFPPLLTLLPEPVYQRRLLGLKPSTSIPEVFGQKANTFPSLRRMAWAPLIVGVTHATSIVLVTGSISLPCGPQSATANVFTMAPVPDGPPFGSITSKPTDGIVR